MVEKGLLSPSNMCDVSLETVLPFYRPYQDLSLYLLQFLC